MRNVGYDTNEQDFKDFMAKFGAVKYALLVKVRDQQEGSQFTHKGTGFVQFKDDNVAE